MQKNILLGIILFFSGLQFCGEKEASEVEKSVLFTHQKTVLADPKLAAKINDFLLKNEKLPGTALERAFAVTCTKNLYEYRLKYNLELALNLPLQTLPKQFEFKGFSDSSNYLNFGMHSNGNFVITQSLFSRTNVWAEKPNDVLRTITPDGKKVHEDPLESPIDFLYCLSNGAIFLQTRRLFHDPEAIQLRSGNEKLWSQYSRGKVVYACECTDPINKACSSLFYLVNKNTASAFPNRGSIIGGSIFQINPQTGEDLRSFNIPDTCAQSFLILKHCVVYSNLTGVISLYDLNSESVEPSFTGSETNIRVLAKLNEEMFVSGNKNGSVTIWKINDLKTGPTRIRDVVIASPSERAIRLVPFFNGYLYFISNNRNVYRINMNEENSKPTLVHEGAQDLHALPDGIILVRNNKDQGCNFYLTPDFLQKKLDECWGKSTEEKRKILEPYPRLYETLFPQRPETMDEWRAKQKPFSIFDSQQNACLALIYLEEKALRGQSSKNNHANAEQSGGGGAAK